MLLTVEKLLNPATQTNSSSSFSTFSPTVLFTSSINCISVEDQSDIVPHDTLIPGSTTDCKNLQQSTPLQITNSTTLIILRR
ncbi:unnamed protein product [Amaranthus hypochondriacus]